MTVSAEVRALRGPKNVVDPRRPYAMHVEPECSAAGRVEDVATIFLSNRECPFSCVMCDLWKNTTDTTVPTGAVPEQIRFALSQLDPATHVKLYNSGNFFDPRAIPPADHAAIANLVADFETVVVENHPQFCDERVVAFQELCQTQLEVAIGLETSHEPTLWRLNKGMTTADFASACEFLTAHNIRVRTFILLRPPWTTEEEGLQRAIESARFAFDCGVECCAMIPTRGGNGAMESLQAAGQFAPPRLASLEQVVDEVLPWKRGRVLADLWDLERFSDCSACFSRRRERLHRTNLEQVVRPPLTCPHCDGRTDAV